ncbi:MAG: hypothetical protein ACYCYO_01435 [Bacilli bacterium]
MGYNSKVVIVARVELAQKLLAQEFVQQANDHRSKEHEGVTYHLFRFDWIRWYEDDPDYPEIAAIKNCLNEHPDDHKFFRCGEEADDIEVTNGFWEDEPFDTGVIVDITYAK